MNGRKDGTGGIRPKLSRKWRSTTNDTRGRDSERLREILYKLSYKHLTHGEWKRLASHWAFTEDQIKAIEHQYNGKLPEDIQGAVDKCGESFVDFFF